MRVILICLAFGASTAVAAPGGSGPSAPDTDMLADVLSTAFLAKNLTLVCSQQDRWFAEDTKKGDLDGVGFADHVEREVLDRLSKTESGIVVIRAANASRAVSLGLIHVMGDAPADEQSERLSAWCKAKAKPLVQGILVQH
ncbi:hypothetical protein ACFQI3_07465 [Hansschlegelia quercus]|uniref:Uncharacterized protein n=1 Tax=Hansschlegelia quercus TaxID=2528245 RepID=A0A4Q9GP27_9HYPH|nr:hypothetical protein [Hansschlegelia quercus]TBN53620.1 hypothetical protein EYR15_07370 [Hansschlegelia quercus]